VSALLDICSRDCSLSYARLLTSIMFSKYQNWGRRVKAYDIGLLPFLLVHTVLAFRSRSLGSSPFARLLLPLPLP
jgi:hypothetical protein